jgi:hypothetical protein
MVQKKAESTRSTRGGRDQPVIVDDEFIMLCECYFDTSDKLIAWDTDPGTSAVGTTIAELANDLHLMLANTRVWKPVRFEDLRVGMTFERARGNSSGMSGRNRLKKGWGHDRCGHRSPDGH